jgi:alpha-tubulin suppressor-like RCC1 family protein
MGDNLPVVDYGPVDPGRPPMLFARGDYTCVGLADGIKCWGDNSQGQLGQGDVNDRGDEPDEMGDNLEVINYGFGSNVPYGVYLGSTHACAAVQTDTGTPFKCWGGNSHAQLGLGDLENRGDEPGEMGDALPWVDVGIGRQDVSLVLGAQHTCVSSSAGVQCWGANDRGQLGQDQVGASRLVVGDAISEMGEALPGSSY